MAGRAWVLIRCWEVSGSSEVARLRLPTLLPRRYKAPSFSVGCCSEPGCGSLSSALVSGQHHVFGAQGMCCSAACVNPAAGLIVACSAELPWTRVRSQP